MTFEQNFTVLSSSLATLPSIANDGWKWALHHQAQNGSSKRLSPEGYLWTATFLGVIAIGSTLANLSVIIVLFKNPQLRTPVNLMLLNLTVSDLLISVCELESPNIACAPNWESPEFADRSYIVYLIVFALIIPAGIICFCYGSIIVFVKRHARSGQGVAKSQRNVTKMISVMIAAFFIAWMPYTIVSATAVFGFGDLITAPIATMPAVFAKASFLYNPIIYIFMNPQARSALCAILTCGSRRDVSQWLHRPSTFLRRRLGTFASVYAESPDGSKDSEMGGSIVNGRRAVARLRAASIKMFTAKAAEREDTSVPDILTESKV
nr:ciliary opsin [Ramazzottius varieornatus]